MNEDEWMTLVLRSRPKALNSEEVFLGDRQILRTLGKELRVRVRPSWLERSAYLGKLLHGTWKESEGDAVLEFPSIKMLEGFWVALCYFISPQEVKQDAIHYGNALQVYACSCMIGCEDLCERTESILVRGMHEQLFLKAFTTAERFNRSLLKRKLFRWLCFSGKLLPFIPNLELRKRSLCVSRDKSAILCLDQPLAAGQFYDVLKAESKEKARFFESGDCRRDTDGQKIAVRTDPDKEKANVKNPHNFKDVIECYVERIRYAGDGNETHFVLRCEKSGEPLLAAHHVDGSSEFVFASSYPSSFQRQALDYLGVLESSFTGTTFITYDHGTLPSDPVSQLFPEMAHGEHLALLYDPNVMGRIPNAMTVVAPDLRVRLAPGPGLVQRFERNQLQGLLVLRTRKPDWNERAGSWTMDFHGRVKLASKKNFKIMESTDETLGEWLMLFGKVSKHRFSLDFRPPLSAMQAFSIALSTFADKLMVS